MREALQRHRKVVFFAHHQARTYNLWRLRSYALRVEPGAHRSPVCTGLQPPACRRVARPYSYPSLPPYYPSHRQVLIDGVQRGALADVPHVRVDGGTSAAARHEAVARFQHDAGVRAALVGITVGGTALTLTAASVAIALELRLQPYSAQAATLGVQAATLSVQVVIFLELYWTPGALLQAGRALLLPLQDLPSFCSHCPLPTAYYPRTTPYDGLTTPLLPPYHPFTTLVPLTLL